MVVKEAVMRRSLIVFYATLYAATSALAQSPRPPITQTEDPAPSQCIAMAQAIPGATYANLTPAGSTAAKGEVTITYAGHSTYLIDTPGGVRIATDFSGRYGANPLPDIITMNRAHSTHFTMTPDPGIAHVLPGWSEEGPAKHRLVVDDVYIRNVPTDIRRWDGGMVRDGNSIFVFEVAGLCIGHLGHLHHDLTDEHYAAIGRLDVLMTPVDGGMTQSLTNMSTIARRLYSSVILPMHRHSTPMSEFISLMGPGFATDYRPERSITLSLGTLPRQPTIVVLDGV